MLRYLLVFVFFFNDTATTEIYTYGHTLSLHDALPIWPRVSTGSASEDIGIPLDPNGPSPEDLVAAGDVGDGFARSEEHTSELQSLMRISYAVFCLKKKKNKANKQ